MELQLRKFGNSTGLTLPPAVLRDLGLAAGQAVTLHTTPEGDLLLHPKRGRPKFSAAQLNAQCNPRARMPADLVAWEQMPAVGSETL